MNSPEITRPDYPQYCNKKKHGIGYKLIAI